jgi:hypothetical protein
MLLKLLICISLDCFARPYNPGNVMKSASASQSHIGVVVYVDGKSDPRAEIAKMHRALRGASEEKPCAMEREGAENQGHLAGVT